MGENAKYELARNRSDFAQSINAPCTNIRAML